MAPKQIGVLLLCVTLAACSGRGGVARTSARAPITRVAPVAETLHGVPVVDNFRWLEGDNSDPAAPGKMTPEVAAWTEAQNGYTRAVLDTLPGRKALEDRLRPLLKSSAATVSLPIMRANRYFFANRAAGQPQPTVSWREGFLGVETLLVDPVALDPSGLTAVVWFSPSEDGTLLAYGTIHAGDRSATLHLLDVSTRKRLPLDIPDVPEGVQWLPDSSGFLYQGRLHRMGTPVVADTLVYRGPSGTLSRDGRWLLLEVWTAPGINDLWLADFDQFRKTGRIAPKVVSRSTPGQAVGTVIDGRLYLHTTKGAVHGRVVSVSAADPAEALWRDVVPERADAVIENVAFGRGLLAVTYRKNASNYVEVFDDRGKSVGTVNQPGIGVVAIAASEDRTEAFLSFSSFNYPLTIFRVDLAGPAAAPKPWMGVEVPVDPSSVEVEQVWYPATDGTRISMFLAHRKGLARSGDAPTMIAGYGGFDASLMPTFSATVFQWFEAGGIFAVPNLRGGGEYGEAWHSAGMLGKKQTVFDDLLSAADWLIASKYTSPSKLAISGGANGGLLAGAAITQHPDRLRAAVLQLPVLDMIRYPQFGEGREWLPEYGSPDDAAAFNWLLAYSPYHHVVHGTKYPGILLTAKDGATPVHAMHARKMAAALQAATGSDVADHPILVRVDGAAGRSPDDVFELQLRDVVDQRIFLMWQLGML